MTSFSVPVGSLDAWRHRLEPPGIAVGDGPSRFRRRVDPLRGYVGPDDRTRRERPDEPGAVDRGGRRSGEAIRGLHSVTMHVRVPGRERALHDRDARVQGRERDGGPHPAVGQRRRAREDDRDRSTTSSAPPPRNGLGTVHHVAMAIATGEEQRRLQQELLDLGYSVTECMDRQYFTVDLLPRAGRRPVRGRDDAAGIL